MRSVLFSPLKLRGIELANRIAVAPLCLYSVSGSVADVLGAQAPYPPQYGRCHPSLQGLPIPPGAPPAGSN